MLYLKGRCLGRQVVSTKRSAVTVSRFSRARLCATPVNGSPPGSPIPGILQARTLEWGTISSSNAWKWKVKVKSLTRVWLFVSPWTVAYQAPPSMGFSRQEYWCGLLFLSPGDLPDTGIEPGSSASQEDSWSFLWPPLFPGVCSQCALDKWWLIIIDRTQTRIKDADFHSKVHYFLSRWTTFFSC